MITRIHKLQSEKNCLLRVLVDLKFDPPPTEKASIDTLPTNPNAAFEAATEIGTHKENHSSNSVPVGDIVIGFADGLTVPFALTAGLSSVGSLNLVILGGLAELFAGSISMGLGAFLAAVTERKRYQVEEAREFLEVNACPQAEEREIYDIMAEYGLSAECVAPLVAGLMAKFRYVGQGKLSRELFGCHFRLKCGS